MGTHINTHAHLCTHVSMNAVHMALALRCEGRLTVKVLPPHNIHCNPYLVNSASTVVPTKSDSYTILSLQLLSKTLTFTLHLS